MIRTEDAKRRDKEPLPRVTHEALSHEERYPRTSRQGCPFSAAAAALEAR
jgi:hypothetical protein